MISISHFRLAFLQTFLLKPWTLRPWRTPSRSVFIYFFFYLYIYTHTHFTQGHSTAQSMTNHRKPCIWFCYLDVNDKAEVFVQTAMIIFRVSDMINRQYCAEKMALSALCCEIMYMLRRPELIGRLRFRRCDKNTGALIDMPRQPIRSDARERGGEIIRNEDSDFLWLHKTCQMYLYYSSISSLFSAVLYW